jgi:hypothetical protein
MDLHGGPGLRAQTVLREFVIGQRATQIVEPAGPEPVVLALASTSGTWWKPRRWCDQRPAA